MTKPVTKTEDVTTIYVESEILTDGSEVFNVRLGGEVFHAIDENAAAALAEAFADAINAHTVEVAEVRYS
jgi:predicted PilT family ATPase